VARRTVHAEEFATTGNVFRLNLAVVVSTTKLFHRDGAVFVVHDVWATAVGCNISCQRQGLLLGVARSLALRLSIVRHHRHTARVNREVNRTCTHANQARTAGPYTLKDCTVGSERGNVGDGNTIVDESLLITLRGSSLCVWGQRGC